MLNGWMILACLCAYVVKGMCGFANTLVFSTILGFRTDNINISPVELLVGYPSNVIIAWRERRQLSVKVWLPLALLVIAGCIPGTFLLKNVDAVAVKGLFGIVIVFLGIEMLLRDYRRKPDLQEQEKVIPSTKGISFRLGLGIIGILSGLLCGLFGIGALLAAYVSRTTDNTHSFRGNLCMVFLVENTFRLGLYYASGILSMEVLKTGLGLLPVMFIGLAAGMLLTRWMKEWLVKRTVMILLICSGVSLLITFL